MTQSPEQEARRVLLDVLANDPMIEQIRKGYVRPYLVSWDDTIRAMLDFAARPTAGIDREAVARIIDPDAWDPVDRCASYVARHTIPLHQRREASLAIAGAILALLPAAAITGERGAAIEECARVASEHAHKHQQDLRGFRSSGGSIEVRICASSHWAAGEEIAKAIRALSQPLPDAPIVGGEGEGK